MQMKTLDDFAIDLYCRVDGVLMIEPIKYQNANAP